MHCIVSGRHEHIKLTWDLTTNIYLVWRGVTKCDMWHLANYLRVMPCVSSRAVVGQFVIITDFHWLIIIITWDLTFLFITFSLMFHDNNIVTPRYPNEILDLFKKDDKDE